MTLQPLACLTSHSRYSPSSFGVEILQLVRNLLRVDWQISLSNNSAIPLIDVDGERIRPKTKAMKFSAALHDGDARHKKSNSLKIQVNSSTCICYHQMHLHVRVYQFAKL